MPLVAQAMSPVTAPTHPARRLEAAAGEGALQAEGSPMKGDRGLEKEGGRDLKKEGGRGLEKGRGQGRRAREEHAPVAEAGGTGRLAAAV